MTNYPYILTEDPAPNIGLIVLQSDERLEQDLRRLLPLTVNLYVSRVPSDETVTQETLQSMEAHLATAAGLLPRSLHFDALAYGCTSGTAQIGKDRVAELLCAGASSRLVTEPLSALVAACERLRVNRLGFLSPYVPAVSKRLREQLQLRNIATPVFGSFEESQEEKVARIAPASIATAALSLAEQGGIDAVFLSCTNLNTLDVIGEIEQSTGLPVLSSNLVLGWHLCQLVGAAMSEKVGLCRLAQSVSHVID